MFILEETLIENGVATPLNQIQFHDYPGAVGAFQSYIKQSENHWIVLFNIHNPIQALAMK